MYSVYIYILIHTLNPINALNIHIFDYRNTPF